MKPETRFKYALAYLLRGARHALHDILLLRTSAIRRKLYLRHNYRKRIVSLTSCQYQRCPGNANNESTKTNINELIDFMQSELDFVNECLGTNITVKKKEEDEDDDICGMDTVAGSGEMGTSERKCRQTQVSSAL